MVGQRAGPSKGITQNARPTHARVALRSTGRFRRAGFRTSNAQSGLPFGLSFGRKFPWISFGSTEPEQPEVKPPPVPVPGVPPVTPATDSPSYPPAPGGLEDTTELGELTLPVIGLSVKNAFPDLKGLRESFGPVLPTDIEYTEVNPVNPALKSMAFLASYDEGYCGHFSIPGKKDEGVAATFQKVMEQSDPFAFIQEHLRAMPQAGRNNINSDELVIFTPGLRTLHAGGEQETAPSRLQHYANTLGCSLAQLHIGTDMDQGDVTIKITLALRGFLAAAGQQLKDAGLVPIKTTLNTVTFSRFQRDKIEAGLAVIGFERPLWQSHVIELLKLNESARKPLVFMPYSRTAAELTSALKEYINQYEGDKAEAEALLRETLTVVSLGNGTKPFGWPNGPAYVHVGGWSVDQQGPPAAPNSSPLRGTDPGVFYDGVHAGETEKAGADAVYVHSDWVWSTGEAHNFASAGSASLRLVMAMNKITGFRELYNKLSAGAQLKKPTFEQVKAAIALTDSQSFMWNPFTGPGGPWDGVGELPTKAEAQKLVGEWM